MPQRALSAAELEALGQVLDPGVTQVELRSMLSFADGASLYTLSSGEAPPFNLSALILANPQGELELLLSSTEERYTLRGVLDLNGDGQLEIWMSAEAQDGWRQSILSLPPEGPAKLLVLGEWACLSSAHAIHRASLGSLKG